MKKPTIPAPIRNVWYATAVRYFWWWFAELLIPLFIFSFVGNYAETGLISASYQASSIIALPLIGYVADRRGVKKLLTISLLMYPFLSISYFLAWIFHVTMFIVLARWINGISMSLYGVGEKTIARIYASKTVSSNIGFMEGLGNMLWIAAALIGVVRVQMGGASIHMLLLLIAPTSLIALYFIRKLPKEKIELNPHSKAHHYKDIRRHLKNMPKKLRTYGFIYAARNAFNSLLRLIIPLYIFADTNNIYLVVISGVLMSIPSLFSYQIGKIADRQNSSAIRHSFVLIGVLFLSFIIMPRYPGKLAILFILAVLFVFLGLTIDNLSNRFVPPHQYGRVEATFEIFAAFGSIIGPIIGWFFMDDFGITTMMLIIGIASVAVSIYYYHKQKYLQHT